MADNFTLTVNYGPGSRRVTEYEFVGEAQHAFLNAYDQADARNGKLYSHKLRRNLLIFDKTLDTHAEPCDVDSAEENFAAWWEQRYDQES